MDNISIEINDIQHIKYLEYSIDLTRNKIQCILGKNGIGKTILFKSLQNIVSSSTFKKTSNKYIFNENSQIKYVIDDKEYLFKYEEGIETLDFKGVIGEEIKQNIYSELPIPFGERFEQFQKLINIDKELRERLIIEEYDIPRNLIDLLNYIYDTNRFDNLREFKIKDKKYYAIELDDYYYIREDYLSSGEYFIINIYKLIQKGCKLIAIDEIDISLDAMAQVRLIEKLREITQEMNINILFSTHSLALIKTLNSDELVYMENTSGLCSFENKSYNYIKSILYGFKGYDKYILTEDEMLKAYLDYILRDENLFFEYEIIYIAGAKNTVDLMQRNDISNFFTEKQNDVITVLDADEKGQAYNIGNDRVFFIPFESVEKSFQFYYNRDQIYISELGDTSDYPTNGKNLYHKVVNEKRLMSKHKVFDYINDKNRTEVEAFKQVLMEFLNR